MDNCSEKLQNLKRGMWKPPDIFSCLISMHKTVPLSVMAKSRLCDPMYHADMILHFRQVLDTEKISARCAPFRSFQHSVYTIQNLILFFGAKKNLSLFEIWHI